MSADRKLTLFHEVSNSRWPPAVPYTDQGEPAPAAVPAVAAPAADPAAAVPAAVAVAVPAAPVTVPPELEYVQKYNKSRKN